MRIEVCGGIASGKTTLAKLLSDNFFENVVYENFKANPFWSIYFTNPASYYFETEITFFLQHYHEIKLAKQKSVDIICDYALIQDRAYAELGIGDNANRMKLFNDLYNEIISEIEEPDIIIYLKCSESVLMDRIAKRGRTEEESIDLRFLKKLNQNILQELSLWKKKANIIEIDSEHNDFSKDYDTQVAIVNLVSFYIQKMKS